MYQLKVIGMIKSERENTVISLNPEYHKALKHLDNFSHVHVFYTYSIQNKWFIRKKILPIRQIDMKKGLLFTDVNFNGADELHVIDLKPYFPSEDSVKAAYIKIDAGNDSQVAQMDIDDDFPIKRTDVDKEQEIEILQTEKEAVFEVNAIGMIRNIHGDIYVQLDKMVPITSNYIKVYWWFHKFDSAQYRQVTECNPPYENAPRSGIFATRSPVRPNPIAMTVVKIKKIDFALIRIYLHEIESFDQTPCLGIQSYLPEKDCITNGKVPNWLSHWPRWITDSEMHEESEAVMYKDSQLEELLRQSNNLNPKQTNSISKPIKTNTHEYEIYVQGARENNLKGIHVRIPYGKITAVVGVSGSGKSSLVNDTIYAECRRRMEYLTHNRNMLQKPKVESITGCIPAVIISQDSIRGNSLSTVGTYTNAYDYLRIIYAGAATRHCPSCGNEIIPLSRDHILNFLKGQNNVEIYDLAKQSITEGNLEERVDLALHKGKGGFYCKLPQLPPTDFSLLQTKQKCYRCDTLLFEMTPQMFSYVDSDSRCPVCNGTGRTVEIDETKIIEHPELSLLDGASSFYGKLRTFLENPNANWMKGQVFGLADAMKENLEKPWNELSIAYRNILLHGSDEVVTFYYKNKKNGRKGEIARPVEGICQIISRIHDENPDTKTLDKYMSQITCKCCNGERLNKEGRMATIDHIRYPEAAAMTFYEVNAFCNRLCQILSENEIAKIESAILSLQEIAESAIRLGIGYLQMNQETSTLSGGEGQRVKLLGASINHMTGILYVFDEPSKGLHPLDYQKVMGMLQRLREEGNTIIMVEHNQDMIQMADTIIEIGPGAGNKGGLLVGEGSLEAMMNHNGTQISKYMNPKVKRTFPYAKQNVEKLSFVKMEHLTYRNLKNISVSFPQNAFTCISGVSGSGKSTLMKGEIYTKVNQDSQKFNFNEVLLVDQLPIGKTSKSIIATYIGIMDSIRIAFAMTELAIANKMDERYFSFNGELGQCPTCKGEGKIKLKYVEDSYVPCSDCKGKRYQKKVLEILYHEKNMDDILTMSIDEAMLFWGDTDEIVLKLAALQRVGLGYLTLGQSTSSLSGGESSRLKLAKELMSKKKNNILYLLDEPTTGLHFSDIDHLLDLISELVRNRNTVLAIEHNKQFIANCDWLIELGPGAGKDGGEVIRQGIF